MDGVYRISAGPEERQRSENATVASTKVFQVLVVDDDPLVNRMVERSLRPYAEIRQEFSIPEEGVTDWEKLDLVVLDFDLPVRNGLRILEEIHEVAPSTPVLFLTGFGDPSLAEKAISKGASLFLTKPVDPSTLQEAFRKLTGYTTVDPQDDRAGLADSKTRSVNLHGRDRRFNARVVRTGEFIEGELTRFGHQAAYAEFELDCGLSDGDEITDIVFHFGDQTLASGEGSVAEVVQSSPRSKEAEIRIHGGWMVDVLEGIEDQRNGEASSRVFSNPGEGVARLELEWTSLSPDYRLAVNDLADVLKAVHNESSRFNARDREGMDAAEVLRRESEFVEQTSAIYAPVFWNVVQRFEAAAIEVETPQLEGLAKAYARRLLFPHTLSSPFLSRVVERPIGVPGDYGMLGQILGNPTEGYTVYDRIVNSWILSCGAASAYRHRVWLLHREILGAVQGASRDGRRAQIMSMASGVAYEIQRFIQNPPEERNVDFTMVDFSKVTLEEAKRQYALLGDYPDGVKVEMLRSSVIDLANQSRKQIGDAAESDDGLRNDYDLVYCAGLFDYLSDRLIEKVVRYLYRLVQPGGTLVVSNFSVENPIRSWMTYVMDWKLIYRSKDDFERLVRRCAPESDLTIETDRDGVEVYAILRK